MITDPSAQIRMPGSFPYITCNPKAYGDCAVFEGLVLSVRP